MMNISKLLNTRKVAVAALLLTALLWSTAGIGFRLLTTVSNGLAISGYRSFFAALFYIAVFRSLPKLESNKWFKIGVFAYATVTTLFVVSNTLTTAANAIVLQYTAPIFVCLYLFFIFKKPIPRYDIVATIIIFTGICIFFVDSLTLHVSPAMTLGNTLAIVSGAAFGLTAIVLGQISKYQNVLIFGNLLNVIIAIPFMILNPIGSFLDLGILIYLGFIQIGLSYLLFSFAATKVSPLELILISALEPILNPIWVFLFDGQAPSFLSLFGGVIIIFTILVRSLYIEIWGNPGTKTKKPA